MTPLNSVSVIICCYNSAKLLPQTLLHIARQKVSKDIAWEIIIVNNNSSDNTKELSFQLAKEYHIQVPFKVVDEPKAGLSYAREAGIKASVNELIILCDDDNWLSEGYVQKASEIMSQNDKIGILGGKNEAEFESTEPFWFKMMESTYAVGEHQYPNGDISETRGRVFGAGMVLKKSVWKEIRERGFENLLSDRKGKKLSTGGDTELCYQCRLLGYRLFYDEVLQLKHYMPKSRLSWSYCRKLQRGIGESLIYLSVYHYIFEKRKNNIIPNPQIYFKRIFKDNIKRFFSSFKRLYFFYFKDIEGEFYFCNYEYIVGQIQECSRLGAKKFEILVNKTQAFMDNESDK